MYYQVKLIEFMAVRGCITVIRFVFLAYIRHEAMQELAAAVGGIMSILSEKHLKVGSFSPGE